jgi:hypothetical protein
MTFPFGTLTDKQTQDTKIVMANLSLNKRVLRDVNDLMIQRDLYNEDVSRIFANEKAKNAHGENCYSILVETKKGNFSFSYLESMYP